LEHFFAAEGIKLEMSRACIHADYRNGVIIALLWRGLVQYIQHVKAQYLFGCASIRTMDPQEVNAIYQFLSSSGHATDEFKSKPLPHYTMPGFSAGHSTLDNPIEFGKSLIPPLLGSYLKAGAKVSGAPALDVSFQCIDFLTVLKMDQLTKLFEKKYTPEAGA
jgi:putative hemolysin